jgi:hypothetical protein
MTLTVGCKTSTGAGGGAVGSPALGGWIKGDGEAIPNQLFLISNLKDF